VEGTTQPLGRGTWLALIAMGIAVFVIANDFSAINVAIPQIEHDFKTSVTTAQWVVNAYALTFGVLIVTGGRIADLFGRRRAFLIGTAIFAFFSVLGGTAQTEAWLHPRRGRDWERSRAADRRGAHRPAELAVDLLP
jgi:MFS family permease